MMFVLTVPAYADGVTISVPTEDEQVMLDDLYKQKQLGEAYTTREAYLHDLQLENAYAARVEYTAQRAQAAISELSTINNDIVAYAMSWVGVTPYVWAGRSLVTGTDCSGFINLIYAQFGYALPTGSDAYQYYVGRGVSYEEIQPGDIVVYDNGAHVAIYAGNDNVIHCSSPENGTVCWNMWYRNITKIVRVLE